MLNIGQKALQHPDSKPYVHDILLSMALAEVRQIEKIRRHNSVLPFTWQFCYAWVSYYMCFLEVCHCKSWI